MKIRAFLFFTFFTIACSYSQVEVYKAIEDFKNNKPEKYPSATIRFNPDFRSEGNYMPQLVIIQDGKKIKIDLTEYWGFKYKGIIFKTVKELGNICVGLLSTGKISYWENAVYILNYTDKMKFSYRLDEGYYGSVCFFSKSIDSKIYTGSRIISGKFKIDIDTESGDDFRSFLKSNAEYQTLIDCSYEKFRKSFSNMNTSEFSKFFKTINKNFHLGGEDKIGILNYQTLPTNQNNKDLRSCIKDLNGSFNPLF